MCVPIHTGTPIQLHTCAPIHTCTPIHTCYTSTDTNMNIHIYKEKLELTFQKSRNKQTKQISDFEASLVYRASSMQSSLHRETLCWKTKQNKNHSLSSPWEHPLSLSCIGLCVKTLKGDSESLGPLSLLPSVATLSPSFHGPWLERGDR